MRNAENIFLDSAGHWESKYIPAFIRRYPFVFSRSEEGEHFVLCIEESFAGFNQEGEGPALIGEDGKASEYTQGMLKFLSQYQAEFQRTQTFCAKLKELNLLEREQVEATAAQRREDVHSRGSSPWIVTVWPPYSSEAIVDLVRSGAYALICHHRMG
jgi:hypothetical protein